MRVANIKYQGAPSDESLDRVSANEIDSIENIFVQEFNNESAFLKIKYLGNLDKIIKQLKEQKVILKMMNDQWSIVII